MAGLGFFTPTPVQVQCIPLALMGKDICACAATGTGLLYLDHVVHIENNLYISQLCVVPYSFYKIGAVSVLTPSGHKCLSS